MYGMCLLGGVLVPAPTKYIYWRLGFLANTC